MDPQTPPKTEAKLPKDSPPVAKHVHSSGHYQFDTNLLDARLAVLADLGTSVPEIPFEEFMEHLAPSRPVFDLHATISSLKSGPNPTLLRSNRWSKFPVDPKESKKKEDEVFRPMPEIFTEVVAAVAAHSDGKLQVQNSTVRFVQNPNQAPASDERRNESRPDGYFVLKHGQEIPGPTTEGEICWADIVLSCEYKVKDGHGHQDDDVRKVAWSLQHALRDDVRRRASFGMTIENTTTRLWFCCRSDFVVSDSFNFIDEPGKLIKLFAAFAFAGGERSLGIDPTIQPVPGDNGNFVITVHPHFDRQNVRRFQTVRKISSYGAEPLRGRGTRVFEAFEIDKNGKRLDSNLVLKDMWIDDDRIREGNILASLLEEANSEDEELVKKHFLNAITHGDVWMEPNIRDDTANGLMRGLNTNHRSSFRLQHTPVLQGKVLPPGSKSFRDNSLAHSPHPNRRYEDKTHYRIVFKEICTPIDEISSLPEIMDVLTQTVTALQLLRKLGWVHRDVSIGNILSYRGHAKLSDLEYAKKRKDFKNHEMRTGTMHFMSIEVAAQKFLFLPRPHINMTNFLERRRRQDVTSVPADQTKVPFSHNYLHDLESLWWVAVWILFHNQFSNSKKETSRSVTLLDAEKRLQPARILFPLMGESNSRRDGFQTDFKEEYRKLPEDNWPFGDSLDDIRTFLISQYTDVEANLPESIDSFDDDIYKAFKIAFLGFKSECVDLKMESLPKIYKELLKDGNSKRPRSESTNDAKGAGPSKTPKMSQKR